MRHALFVALALLAAVSAKALNPATEAFLTEIKIDPKSADVQAIAGDVVITEDGTEVSLDSLAAVRDIAGTQRFVATRKFVKAYMKNTKTPFPDRKVYDTAYLNEDEVTFILASLKKPFKLA
jgi:hypothetical protein